MIITVCSAKGGVSKTTTAIHLAAFFAEHGPTLLVDSDMNQSSLSWCNRGPEFPFDCGTVTTAAKKYAGKEYIVLDTQANPARNFLVGAAEGCDFLLLPTSPDALSMEGLLSTVEILREIETPFGVVLTMVDSRRKGTAETARATLEGLGIPVLKQMIRRLVAFEDAPLSGCLVQDTGHRMGRIAWGEYRNLGKELLTYA
jgi:chromosome partitioning protein